MLLQTLFLMSLLHLGSAYKILILPMNFGYSSRLRNMEKMADLLVADSHEVAIVVNNKIRRHVKSTKIKVIEYKVPDEIPLFENFTPTEEFKLPGWLEYEGMGEYILHYWQPFCQHLLFDRQAMDEIRSAGYELIFGDMIELCSGILADHLNAYTILYQNFGFSSDTSLFYPALPGMNCIFQGVACMTDDMDSIQKLKNLYLIYRSTYSMLPKIMRGYEAAATKAGLSLKQDLAKTLQESILLLNTDFVFEYPRPMMPNVFPIAGVFQEEPASLPEDLLLFVEGSSPYGVIVVSFGTQISQFSNERADVFARAFSQLKQRVIWRHSGVIPGLSKNVKLVGWFPQNDVLAHPLTKLFISHCGISGVMESIYNAVPVLAMPLFADQYFNAAKLVHRVGMGMQQDYFSMTESDLLSSIEEMLANKTYKENAVKASSIIRNQPIQPKDRFLHLVNLTIQTKGAKHLFHEIGLHQTWYEMMALDVILLVLLLLMIFCALTAIMLLVLMKFLCNLASSKTSTRAKID